MASDAPLDIVYLYHAIFRKAFDEQINAYGNSEIEVEDVPKDPIDEIGRSVYR